jgi:hypothetical protein
MQRSLERFQLDSSQLLAIQPKTKPEFKPFGCKETSCCQEQLALGHYSAIQQPKQLQAVLARHTASAFNPKSLLTCRPP